MNIISAIFNFDKIGEKIKTVTKWSCWITILLIWIAAPIAFIALAVDDWTVEFCWIPLVGAIVGPVFVWIGSWTLYAFGEYVDDIHAIRYDPRIKNIEKSLQLLANSTVDQEKENVDTATKSPVQDTTTTPQTNSAKESNDAPIFQASVSVPIKKAYAEGEYIPGRTYSDGDEVIFEGKRYVCVAQGSTVWNPAQFPGQWKEISNGEANS